MRRTLLAAIAAAALSAAIPATAQEVNAALAGTWKGPWYRGMTSGVMTLEVAPDGSGNVRFTNLDNFGDGPATLAKVSIAGDGFEFSANGTGGREFAAAAQLAKNGSALRGTARYEGFGVKFELKRADD